MSLSTTCFRSSTGTTSLRDSMLPLRLDNHTPLKILTLFAFLSGPALDGQVAERESSTLLARPAQVQIVVDGDLNEEAWKVADASTEFWQNFPYDTSRASIRTLVTV